MMYPPVVAMAQANATVVALLKTGTGPLRLFPFEEYTQDGDRPYAVWQTVYGSPENLLACVPSMDTWGVQIDAYALNPQVCREVAQALRDAFEVGAYIVGWNGEFREVDTKLYRISFTVEFMTERS